MVRGRDDKKERVENLFERARQSGAESGAPADLETQARSFRGRARTLGVSLMTCTLSRPGDAMDPLSASASELFHNLSLRSI